MVIEIVHPMSSDSIHSSLSGDPSTPYNLLSFVPASLLQIISYSTAWNAFPLNFNLSKLWLSFQTNSFFKKFLVYSSLQWSVLPLESRDWCVFFLLLLLLILFIYFLKFVFSWRIIVVQYCVDFYLTTKWISYKYTYIPSFLGLHPTPISQLPKSDTVFYFCLDIDKCYFERMFCFYI